MSPGKALHTAILWQRYKGEKRKRTVAYNKQETNITDNA